MIQTLAPIDTKFGETIGDTATVLGLVNGMIGGTILILPLMGIQTGYITTIIVSFAVGYVSYYTANIYVLHLGKEKDIREAVSVHFNYDQKYVKLFSFFMWVGFVPFFLEYFRLMCLQIQGLAGSTTQWISLAVFISLILLVTAIRYFHIGQETIALGMITTVVYFIFIAWAQITAPAGPKTVQPFGQPYQLAATLVGGYSIHNFVAQNMVKNPNRKVYSKLNAYSFVIGALAYTFFTEGSFAVINRLSIKAHPETIYDYFKTGDWQVTIIQVIYLFHFYTVFPNFTIVSNVQFFNMFGIQIQKEGQWFEYFYILIIVSLSYLTYILGLSLVDILVINGTIICFTYVIVFPIWMHLKCVLYDRSSGFIEGDEEWNKGIQLNRCECDVTYSSKWGLYLEICLLIATLIYGVFFTVFGLQTLGKASQH